MTNIRYVLITIIRIIIIIMGLSGRAMNKRVSPAAFLIVFSTAGNVFSTGQRQIKPLLPLFLAQAAQPKNLLEILHKFGRIAKNMQKCKEEFKLSWFVSPSGNGKSRCCP